MTQSREHRLVEAFVSLADSMVVGYDIVDLLHTLVEECKDILDATDAGIILADESGVLEVIASTSERSALIGLMQLGAGEGPCVEAYETGETVSVPDIAAIYARWPRFSVEASDLGYASVHAIPLRLRGDTVGSLNLFRDGPGELTDQDAVAARGLADVATVSILHERALRESSIARAQLQHALSSRVIIEQAKGVLSHSENIDMDEAFRRIRESARSSNRRLSDVARDVVDAATAYPRTAFP
ncbi:GAF and ANTAR domain-containing protein [Leifsonia flava]|uniref:ANTAR domain-containing protein n=1 Tax=Orlajensenia leifsoniae TaxID=2561933 RepID=A0A4Y9R6Q4_9MICO|nr:GAF and ANTAR domain-containing protein [Leifsonia flava]TFV99808.1 ANTAR domain-containing protein [Leifsonia flava]